MRVAMLSPLFESVPPRLYGGTERVVYNLCRGLDAAGIDVVLFASGDSTYDGKLVPVVGQALRLNQDKILEPNAYHIHMLSLVADAAADFDVIHNHHDYWMLPLTRLTQTPVVTTIHGRLDIPEAPIVFSGYTQGHFVSISDAQRKPLPSINWVKTIYHGICAEKFTFHQNPGKYLAFLGRISPEKRPDLAVKIAQWAGVPLKIAAKIEGTASQNYYDTLIKPHVDGKSIEFLGEISEDEKSEFLGNALALVFPIDWPEPFGLVVIESLVCGTPVLARPCGSMSEILIDGLTGFLHHDVNVLADRVKDISQIDRRFCREWVEQHFSLQRMTEDYIHVYRDVIQKRHGDNRHRWNLLHSV